jgi:hypothetical protein
MKRGWVLPVLAVVVLVVGVVSAVGLAGSPSERAYSAFLDDVASGRVEHVVQTGDRLEVQAAGGTYVVQVPTLLTDVFGDMQAAVAAAGSVFPSDLFEARPAADPVWVALAPIVAANLLVGLGIVALVVVLLRRGPTAT